MGGYATQSADAWPVRHQTGHVPRFGTLLPFHYYHIVLLVTDSRVLVAWGWW